MAPRPKRKEGGGGAGPSRVGKRRAQDAFFDQEDGLDAEAGALDGEDDELENGAAGRGEDGEDGEEEDAETADEKRLRLAKAYLARLRSEESAAADDEDDENDDGLDERVARRLGAENDERRGHAQRRLCARLAPPPPGGVAPPGRLWRGHRLAVTSLALRADDAVAFSASKEGTLLRWDVETGARESFPPQPPPDPKLTGPVVAPTCGARTVLAAAASADGRYVATGGLEKRVHVWDARSRTHIRAFPGHRDAVAGLAFREGTHELYSASFDRTVKVWNVADLAYVDTLYGHQAEPVALHAARRSRAVTVGRDRTARVWKVEEDSQLVFRAPGTALESCCFVSNGAEFLTGGDDGSVALWSPLKKRPVRVWQGVHHGDRAAGGGGGGGGGGRSVSRLEGRDAEEARAGREAVGSAGCAACGWVGAVACARNGDLAVSGAGDGLIRLWQLGDANRELTPLHALPARGFVNALAVAASGRFVLAGVGQEPRLGRWSRDAGARNGVLLHELPQAGGEE